MPASKPQEVRIELIRQILIQACCRYLCILRARFNTMWRRLQLAGEACGWGLDKGALLLQGVHHVLLARSGIIEAYEVNIMLCLANQS